MTETREWLESLIDAFETNPLDRAEVQKLNRASGETVLGKEKIKGVGKLFRTRKTVCSTQGIQELLELFEDWYDYFNVGYKAKHSIDDLPTMIINKAKEILEE